MGLSVVLTPLTLCYWVITLHCYTHPGDTANPKLVLLHVRSTAFCILPNMTFGFFDDKTAPFDVFTMNYHLRTSKPLTHRATQAHLTHAQSAPVLYEASEEFAPRSFRNSRQL